MDAVIELENWEIYTAGTVAIIRRVECIRKQNRPNHGADSDKEWQMEIEGCLGEYALSKFLNLRWCGKGSATMPDVGEVDVRTRSRHDYDLILHPKDPDDRVFWLVTGKNGSYRIRGWILAKDGKQEKYWKDPSGKNRWAYFVPVSDLNQST